MIMSPRTIIHRLLYLALIDIRMKAYDIQNQEILHLADLFHNIPLKLDQVSSGDEAYEEILAWLQKEALEKGVEEWLRDAIENMAASHSNDSED